MIYFFCGTIAGCLTSKRREWIGIKRRVKHAKSSFNYVRYGILQAIYLLDFFLNLFILNIITNFLIQFFCFTFCLYNT